MHRLLLSIIVLGILLAPSLPVLAQGSSPAKTSHPAAGTISATLRMVAPGSAQGSAGARAWVHPGGAALLAREKASAQQHSPSGAESPSSTISSGALTSPLAGVSAIDSDQSQCAGCYPPDGALAVGPTYIVGAVNTAVAVWDKSGNTVIAPVSLPNFLSLDPNCANDFLHGFSDPFVEYDPWANQFIVGMLNYDIFYDSTLCVAVTATHDPTGTWNLYDFPVNLSFTLFDFPHAGVGSNALYITGNLFQSAVTYIGARVYAIDTSAMYAGSPPESPTAVYQDVQQSNAAGQPVDTLIPTQGIDVSNVMYFTAVDNCDDCDAVRLWKWSSPFGSDTFSAQGAVQVDAYTQPPDATQLGGDPIATNDTRELAAAWHAGTISGAHTIGCDPGGGTVDCTQWYQIGNVDASPTLLQQGTVGTSGQNRFYPTLTMDESGNVALGYSFSSPKDYAGIRYTGISAGSSTLQPEQTLVAGQTTITTTGTYGRYGDFGTAVVDPTDGCTVWQLEEYAQSGQEWGTWLGAYKFTDCGSSALPDFSLSAAPPVQSVYPGDSTTYSINLSDINGFTGSASLGVSGLPSGSTYVFSPDTVSDGFPSSLSVTTSTSTPGGSYTLTISGTSGSISHQATVELDVKDFSLSADPNVLNITDGSSGTSTITVTALGGYSANVDLSVDPTSIPTGLQVSVNPATVTPSPSGTATLSVTADASMTSGQYTLTITGTGSDGVTHSLPVTVNVSAQPPDFSLSVSPTSETVSGGKSTAYTVFITSVNSYSGDVTLSVSGLPRRESWSWSSGTTTVTLAAGATLQDKLTINTSRTPRGTFTLTITGTGSGGSPSHSENVTLTVTR